jgi:hypothetical protein
MKMTFIPPDWNADVASKHGAELSHLHAKCNVMRESLSDWEDCMASCFAYLRSALSGIEQLSIHPSPSLGDAGYLFELASRSVAIALVALDECNPAVTSEKQFAGAYEARWAGRTP